MKVKSKMVCPVVKKMELGPRSSKNLKKIYLISDEKNSSAISADDLIIRSVKKQSAKLGYIIKPRKNNTK